MSIRCRVLASLLLAALCLLPGMAAANSAEPPALVILVNNPPEDLTIELLDAQLEPLAHASGVAWEGYYSFYGRQIQGQASPSFRVSTGGDSFVCTLSGPWGYRTTATLDLAARTLTPGTPALRSAALTALRVVVTLLLEAGVFVLFGFRQRRSWLVFLLVNLVTQGTLNILLASSPSLFPSYLILGLILGEIFVFIAEMVAFPLLVKEHKKRRAVLYALVANLVSAIAGGYLISLLPV